LDGFERKLEDAQIELGIPSGDQVSVKFMQEGSLTAALFELLPTLMLIGATYW
jgi:AFG3 family protein